MKQVILILLMLVSAIANAALDPQSVSKLSRGENEEKIEALDKLIQAGDPDALKLLQALHDGTLHTAPNDKTVIVDGDKVTDVLTGQVVTAAPDELEKVTINNQIRRQLDGALAGLKLFAAQRNIRLAAAKELQTSADADMLPLINRAIEKETDAEIKASLAQTQASIQLKDADPAVRLKAVHTLAESSNASLKTLLVAMLEKKPDGSYVEPDEKVRAEITTTLKALESRVGRTELIGNIFSGLSLASVLLLAALGLAITFGLMGIINMAHGELLMIGAYSTYLIQTMFRSYFPGAFDFYLLAAVPTAFCVAALVGMALERSVIRWLYGRPLETLLATWGISLMLIQVVRTIFGAQNVEVMNPSWMSGGIAMGAGLVLPYNRIVIIGFAIVVVLLVWLLLNRTRLGLFVRAVMQNRTMADCVGVPTRRVDMLTFGLGCGIAGLGGCALSQIGNVGPELGQGYIVDSFMVVVLGGVGQLSGTVIAALGLGEMNKFLEPFAGAVMAKIIMLVFIIIFIQKRPQGLFALKGRSVEA